MEKMYDWKKIKKHQEFQNIFRGRVNKVISHVQKELKEGNVKVTFKKHLFHRIKERNISFRDVEKVVTKGSMIEYQGTHLDDDEKRKLLRSGKKIKTKVYNENSMNIIMGHYVNGRPIHVCVNIQNKNEIHIKTVYNPENEESWKWVKGRGYQVRAFYKK